MENEVVLSRRVAFSSGHRYWLASKSDAENSRLFGRWASRHNHGHNYVLWVGARGPVDPVTGMVVNIKDIDDLLQAAVVGRFDQRSINDEVPEFREVVPCLENLVGFFRDQLRKLPAPARLVSVKLEESPLLYAAWEADSNMLTLTRSYEFAASHRLYSPELSESENEQMFGKCARANGHGHNYTLEVTVTGEQQPETGFFCDIDALDSVVLAEVVDRYDHRNLNLDVPELAGKTTTSENVALAIFDKLQGRVPGTLARVRLYETARNMFEVSR